MLSISGMLGPSSPTPQRPSWYENQPEKSPESEEQNFSKSPESSIMTRPQNHQSLQTLLNAAISSAPSSPEQSFKSNTRVRSYSEEISPSFHQNKPFHDRKRKASNDDREQISSPNRNRFAASSSPAPKKKRAPRPQYTKEQEDFIWFCRDDLSMSWRKVVELYNNYWHPFEVEPHIRSESGLQSRYYRILDFPVKIRKKKEPSRPDLGLIPSTERRYPWMGVIKADIEEKRNAERSSRYSAATRRGERATRGEISEINKDDEGSSNETERAKSESGSTDHDSKRPGLRKPEKCNSLKPTEIRSQIISHTSETDSEVENDREWENSRPSTSSSYEIYDLKSVISNEDPINIRIPLSFAAEGPICLPPLRRYMSRISTINCLREDTEDRRRRAREKPQLAHGCKISVTNPCV